MKMKKQIAFMMSLALLSSAAGVVCLQNPSIQPPGFCR